MSDKKLTTHDYECLDAVNIGGLLARSDATRLEAGGYLRVVRMPFHPSAMLRPANLTPKGIDALREHEGAKAKMVQRDWDNLWRFYYAMIMRSTAGTLPKLSMPKSGDIEYKPMHKALFRGEGRPICRDEILRYCTLGYLESAAVSYALTPKAITALRDRAAKKEAP